MSQLDLARIASIVALALGCASEVPAAVITVGTPAGPMQDCDFDDLQAALNYVNSNGDTANELRLMYYSGANGYAFYKVAASLTLDAGKSVRITGGYGSCTQISADSTRTNIDGHKPYDSGLGSVLSIHAGTGSTVQLRMLNIGGGQTALCRSPTRMPDSA